MLVIDKQSKKILSFELGIKSMPSDSVFSVS